MARFISLSDIIQRQINETVQLPTAPIGTPTAYILGQQEFKTNIAVPPQGAFRWGISTWGIDSITGSSMPDGTNYGSDAE